MTDRSRRLWVPCLAVCAAALLCLATSVLAAESGLDPGKSAGKTEPASPGKAGDKPNPAGEPGAPPAPKTDPSKPAPTPVPVPNPAPAEPERPDPPEPAMPAIEDLPPGLSPGEWYRWNQDQDVIGLRRINIEIAGGYATLLSDSMAGTGVDAPSYSNVLSGGAAIGAEIRFALMPVLSVGVSFFNFTIDGTHYYPPSQPNLDYFFGPYGNSLAINQLAINLKMRFPLLVWQLAGSNLRLSRSEEITGILLFLKVGAGPAFWSQYRLMVRESDTGMEISNLAYYGKTTNFSMNFGGGVEVRWKWGSIEAGLMVHRLGTPESAWPPKSDSEPLSVIDFRLGVGIHF